MHRHDLDVVSLMFGLLFAGLGGLSLLHEGPGIPARWAAPALLIGVGVVGLVASGASARRRSKPTEPTEPSELSEPSEEPSA